MAKQAGYEHDIVTEFLEAQGFCDDEGKLVTLNGVRVNYAWRDCIERWERRDIVPLGRLDELLLAHGLMLYELDMWAEETYGRTGWFDPYAEPEELAA